MSPNHWIIPPLLALCVAACAEVPSTGLATLQESSDLELLVPEVSPELFIDRRFTVFGAPDSDGPAQTEDLISESESAIWDEYTDLEFQSSRVQAWGEHHYRGNKGRIEVSVVVRHDGALLGQRSGSTEQTHSFLSPFDHHIIGHVIMYTDKACGLSADAQSEHSAWWEMAFGSGPNLLGRTVAPSYSDQKAQPPCEEPTVDYSGGSSGGGGGGGVPEELTADFTCWAWFSYDELTLEVLDIHATWCTGGG